VDMRCWGDTAKRSIVMLGLGLIMVGAAACSTGPEDSPESGGPATTAGSVQPTTAAAPVPSGWQEATVDGLTFAYPPEFERREDVPEATLQVGVPFTGQPAPPPQVQVFVETGEVGPLEVREPLTRAQIQQQLGPVSIPSSTPVPVTGASAAVEFTYEYTTQGGTSVLDTPLEPTPMRQSELLIDVPGLPKYGLRYSAPAVEYDEDVWQAIRSSIRVT
jgi:hypothetical protein